ncbi:RNA polymerase-associated protein RapA [Ferrovum myxofaciens]|uniref:RNA polymerase-associated protein RapA n=1 Tax=Ferrovum myxofaciens TaxID=416213 RepID=A0A149VWK8_9PROT|nr:SNF2-related protein [Ferrovum myxofaciens]KXW57566.1 RNA polymerase-associated protein RapA [Ferrovum myxofaciens]
MKNLWPFKPANTSSPASTVLLALRAEYLEAGVIFSAMSAGWLDTPYSFSEQGEQAALLAQLTEEGFAERDGDTLRLRWGSLYQLLKTEGYQDSLPLLGLPPLEAWRPKLESLGGLTDTNFSILLAGWIDSDGNPVQSNTEIKGAVLKCGQREILLPEESWLAVCVLGEFHRRPQDQRGADSNRLAWAGIRRHALTAKADLSDFLQKTIVITPERLNIILRKTQFGDSKTVEVIPGFEGQPSNWIERFDSFNTVLERYQIPGGAGLVHVILSPEAQTVLREIKLMPGRRVAGDRAEAFLRNPIAALGPDAAKVIDPEQFEQAREDAGISYARFTAKVARDAGGLPVECALLVEESIAGNLHSETLPLTGEDVLLAFIEKLRARIAQGAQCLFWEGYDLEILGDTPDQLTLLESALRDLHRMQWFSTAEVFDLSRYAEGKIEGIGEEQPYYSAFIARKDDESSWFPDNIICGFSFVPEDGAAPVDLPLTDDGLKKIRHVCEKAKADGLSSFDFPGCPKPIPVVEAEQMISIIDKAKQDIGKGNTPKTLQDRNPRKGLILKPNIVKVDYEERRGVLAISAGQQAKLPGSLKKGIALKEHQISGVAWLQHLWSLSPQECRGALLADDMGLGKTVQLLTFIATCLEENHQADPFLIVAPVSLLENWQEEMEKFFVPGAFPLLTLYGSDLAKLRTPNADLDDELAGIRLLCRNWLGSAKVVLTTYETLRDLEFTLAAQKWSAVICDEAQKIKNPNAMMTRAAKKQNVRFKIACTGTPVENSLADLWCLFDFIQPGLLGALNEFGSTYRKPIEAETDEQKQRVEELRSIIEPQLLRRIKADVAKDLPKKIIVDSCNNLPLSKRQRTHYANAIAQYRKQSVEGVGLKNHLGLLFYLRRLCADPQPMGQYSNLATPLEEIEDHSPKMKWLLAELGNIKMENEKVILFCELRDVQRLLQRAISERFDLVPAIINGDTSTSNKSTVSRQKQIRAFQEKSGFGAIILSPLAAGFGLNIQAANHVIHFTRTWNPAKEDQATDRAYRIGQTKEVFVYCPVVVADDFTTFDAKLHRLLEWKRNLSGDMLNGVGDLSQNDFGDLENVGGGAVFDNTPITLSDVITMMPDAFEVFCTVLWSKLGFKTNKMGGSGDGGIDVVAINGNKGVLIQCKSSSIEGQSLGWDAVKEVVAGAAAYERMHVGVVFQKVAATNQLFNGAAKEQAKLNNVELLDCHVLEEMLKKYPVPRSLIS